MVILGKFFGSWDAVWDVGPISRSLMLTQYNDTRKEKIIDGNGISYIYICANTPGLSRSLPGTAPTPPPLPPSPVQVTKTPGLENLLSFRVKVNFEGR